jgi:hypothetical protein
VAEPPYVAVGIPTIASGTPLEHCVGSILRQHWVAHDIVLIENGSGASTAVANWASQGIETHRPPANMGVAASWNYACKRAWARGRRAILLVNDDVVLADRYTFFHLWKAVERDSRHLYLLGNQRFAAFCVTRTVWEEVGAFDEGFWPAYYEDCDWHYRVRLAGIPGSELGIPLEHVGGASRGADPELQALVERTFPMNAQRYVRKWGGQPDHEKFTLAWNGSEADEPVRLRLERSLTAT